MCKLDNVDSENKEGVVPNVAARSEALSDGVWVVGLTLSGDHPARSHRPPTRFHFVLDNSGSMGSNTRHAKECFADLVGLANGPCSLVAFDSQARLLGETFCSPEAFRAAKLPNQGGTNITAGVEAAVDIIKRCESHSIEGERTHHVLVLLSDGAHTVGPKPELRLPGLGAELHAGFPALRLSVVVVGVTRSSDTSMGMLLKQSLETVALPALEPIYFANTPAMMGQVLSQMHAGLASLRGSLVHVVSPSSCHFVRAVGEDGVSSVDVLADAEEQALLCLGAAPPATLVVDGVSVRCTPPEQGPASFDTELVTAALQTVVDAMRVRRVAIGADGVRPAVEQLSSWVLSLEARSAEQRAATSGVELSLAKASPASRLAQHKALKRATHGARELRNQLAEIDAHNANDSASQAAFLTGASSKYGAKALVRSAAHNGSVDSADRVCEMSSDLARIAPKMKQALREDFCGKLATLEDDGRARLRERLCALLPGSVQCEAIHRLCSGSVTMKALDDDMQLAKLVDSGIVVESLMTVTNNMRQSYISLYTAWEQLNEWCDCTMATASCRTEYELLMCLGSLGYPIDVQRRAATQMDPYAMDITRVRASLADTASLSTALQSDQAICPPEGGVAVQDLLVLVDPDVPRASRLAMSSMLLKESYTSVILCRDLHMFTGNKMRIALHAHALLAALQPPPVVASKDDLEAQLRRQYLGRAFQCAQCRFGPIDHLACEDLQAHHGEQVNGAIINNACPKCHWFSEHLGDWPKWDGTVPSEAIDGSGAQSQANGEECLSAASVDIALRICYSARALWQVGAESEADSLCQKLANWDTLTAADGVDHPVQVLLASAVLDDLPEGALGLVPVLGLLNEVCARRARDQLRQTSGTDEASVVKAAHKRAAAFLGITAVSAPSACPLEQPEPGREAVMESCCADYALDTEVFDFKGWVRDTLKPWTSALVFARRLRSLLQTRTGGWPQLARDMEAGPDRYVDVVQALQKKPNSKESLRALLGVERPCDAPCVLATMAAQAFLHQSSQLRRVIAAGGSLQQPLGDVRDSNTLRSLCVQVRMTIYEERVAEKMREWGRLGASLTFQRARAVDLEQYADMCQNHGGHVHGLDKPTFWGLWNAATGPKAKQFLSSANQGFLEKHGRTK